MKGSWHCRENEPDASDVPNVLARIVLAVRGCGGPTVRRSRLCAPATIVLGVIAVCLSLAMTGCRSGPACGPPDLESRRLAELDTVIVTKETDWQPEARRLLKELDKCWEDLKPYQWMFRDAASVDRVRQQIGPALMAQAGQNVSEVSRRLPEIMWQLWLVTGRSPFKDLGDGELRDLIDMLPASAEAYRKFIEESGGVPESVLQRDGIEEATSLLATRFWLPAFEYLADKFDFDFVYYTSHHMFFTDLPLPGDMGEAFRLQVQKWRDRNLNRLVWDGDLEKFRSRYGEKVPGTWLSDAYDRYTSEAFWRKCQQINRTAPSNQMGDRNSSKPMSAATRPSGPVR